MNNDINQMEDARKANLAVMIFSGTFAVLVGWDLFSDYRSGSPAGHLMVEGGLLILSGAFFVWGLGRLSSAQREIRTLQGSLDHVQREKDHWQREAHQLLAGLSIKIEHQFDRWRLTPAEKEVGFLLLKGCSLKEIADARQTRLKTVQQQAQSIYQKTGLANRSELAAFFLEDLLPPQESSPETS